MCTKEEVKQVVEANNEKRNKNLDKKLSSLRKDIFDHNIQTIKDVIAKIEVLPGTQSLINNFEKECILRRGEIALTTQDMQKDIKQILKEIKEDKEWKILFKAEIEQNYVRKEELETLQETVHEAEVDIEKLKKFMWQSTALAGAAIWFWNSFAKDFIEGLHK